MRESFQRLAAGRRPYLLIAGLSLLVVLPIFFIGMHSGADLPQHVQFASTYRDALLDGDPFPGWGANENLGYGSLGVRFYPPLSGLVTGAILAVTGNWLAAFSLALFFFTVTGGIGVFLLAREFVSETYALLAAIIFVISPYHLAEIYTTSLYAEYAGASLLPFSLFFIARICRDPRWRYAAGLGVSYALLILAHLPLTVIGSIGLAVFSLAMLRRGKLSSALPRLAAGVAGALAATSFYWIKVVYESGLMRHTKLWNDRIFDYDQHFLLTIPSDEVFGIWFNNLVLLTLIAAVACSWYGWAGSSRREDDSSWKGLLVLFFFAVLMTTPLSYPLWMFVPYLSETQFPWRWMAVASAPAAVIAGAGITGFASLLRDRLSWRSPTVWAAVLTIALAGGAYNKIVSKFAKEHIAASEFSAWASRQAGSKGFEYFWNLTADESTFDLQERVMAEGRRFEVLEWEREIRRFKISAGRKTNVRVATLYYPHWKAAANGNALDVSASGDGAILIGVPAEETTVRLWFEEPAYVTAAEWVSLSAWILMLPGLVFLAAGRKRSRKREEAG